jgi:hypothetical protein
MSISSERLVSALGKLTSAPEVVLLLRELELGEHVSAIEDGVSSDVEVPKHGVALFFRTAHHLRNVDGLGALPSSIPIVSDVKFSRKGFGGGPGYDGALPRGLTFADARSAVRERLGPPARVNPNVANDRWDYGDQYMTVGFARDGSCIKGVTCGLRWTL